MPRQTGEEVVHPPRVTWRGEGLDQLRPEQRTQIDAALRAAVARATAGAVVGPGGLGLAAGPGAPAPAPAVRAAAGGSSHLIAVKLLSQLRAERPDPSWSRKVRQAIYWMEPNAAALAHPFVREIFDEWTRTGDADDFNPLFVEIWFIRFYEAFCLRVAKQMLSRSRDRMADHVKQLTADRDAWARRLSRLIDWLAPSAERLRGIRYGQVPMIRDTGPPSGGTVLPDEQPRRPQPPQSPGAPSGGTVLPPELEPPPPKPATAEEVVRLESLFRIARELEPLLVVLTVRDGRDEPLEDVVSRLAGTDPYGVLQRVLDGLDAMQRESLAAEQALTGEMAASLELVREEANKQLGSWLAGNRAFARAVERMHGGIAIATTLGVAAFALMFVFPPAGIVLGAAVGIGSAVSSVSAAIRAAPVSRGRLAQHGFDRIMSLDEYGELVTAAVVDVFFALLDVYALGKEAAKLTASTARQAARALGRSLERNLLAALRRFEQWPETLLQRLRARVRAHLDLSALAAAEAERLVEASVRRLQAAMLARYERRLAQLQRDFQEALEAGLRPDELDAWLLKNMPPPDDFLGRLARDDSLLEEVLGPGRQGAGAAAAAAAAALRKELGALADLLTETRLAYLTELTKLSYETLARRLATILTGAEDAAGALERLERLLEGRGDARLVLEALERSPAPLRVLEALTPQLLNVRMVGGFEELFAALLSDAPSKVLRVASDVNRYGEIELLRELEGPGGTTIWQRWVRSQQAWATAADIVPPRGLRAAPPRAAQLSIAAAERAAAVRAALAGDPKFVELLDAAGRDGQEIMAAIGALEKQPLTPKQLDGVKHFLQQGGDPRVLSEILARLSGRTSTLMHDDIRKLLEKLPNFRPNDLYGLKVALAGKRWSIEGIDDILQISRNFSDVHTVFGALGDVAGRAEGLESIIGQLANPMPETRQGTLGQLLLGRKLLEDPAVRIVFEVPIEVEGRLLRRLDIRVISAIEGTTLFEVESKEITKLKSIVSADVRRQFAKDVARAAASARAGEAPLEHIKWFVREDAILAEGAAGGLTSAGLRDRLRDSFRRAFELEEVAGLTKTQREAALRDFDENFDRIFGFF